MRVAAILACACLLVTARAEATENGDDGLYGRLRGDLVLSVEGALLAQWNEGSAQPAMTTALRARYLDMIGLALGYDARLAGGRYDAAWSAVELRPLLLARFAQDWEHGPRWLDLLVDSIGLELGLALLRPGDTPGGGLGLAMVLGTGFELPLVWSRGSGLLLRVQGRWFPSRQGDVQGPGAGGAGFELGAGLVLRTIVRTGLVRGQE